MSVFLDLNLSLTPLRARQSDKERQKGKKSDNYGKMNKGKGKEIIPKIKQRRLKALTLQEAIEKSQILLYLEILIIG